MLSVLSERQKAIVEAITMRLHTKPALRYLTDVGHKMSEATFFREKKKIEEMKFERMQHIALYFQDQHLERIDKCELVEKLCWENYRAEKDPTKRVKILESIITMQPYLSGYYEATKTILESTVGGEQQDQRGPSYEVPPIDDEPIVGFDGEPWTIHDKPQPKPKEEKSITTPVVSPALEVTKEEGDGDGWKLLKCSTCQKSFYNNFTLSAHQCNPT